MKRNGLSFLMIGLLLLALSNLEAQTITMPQVSPAAVTTQTFGLTTTAVSYHRPSAKGREIWGKLVPYNGGVPFPWRAGANENTTFSVDRDVMVEGKKLPAGTYGLHIIASEKEATIIFSSNSTSWGSYSYNPKEDVLRVQVTPKTSAHTELLTWGFEDFDMKNAAMTCVLSWGKKQIPIRLSSPSIQADVVENGILELRSTTGFSWQGWNSLAGYCLTNDYRMEDALKWANRSITGGFGAQPTFQNQSTKAAILEKLGKKDEAKVIMDKAMGTATNAQLNQYAYQLLGSGQHDRAIEMFIMNSEKNATDPNVWDSLGEGYMGRNAKGDKKKAIKAFKKALSMNPPANLKANSEKNLKALGQ